MSDTATQADPPSPHAGEGNTATPEPLPLSPALALVAAVRAQIATIASPRGTRALSDQELGERLQLALSVAGYELHDVHQGRSRAFVDARLYSQALDRARAAEQEHQGGYY